METAMDEKVFQVLREIEYYEQFRNLLPQGELRSAVNGVLDRMKVLHSKLVERKTPAHETIADQIRSEFTEQTGQEASFLLVDFTIRRLAAIAVGES